MSAVADADSRSSLPPKTGMFRELLYIHTLLRRDLKTVRGLALHVQNGLSAADVLAQIRDLESSSPLWQLRYGCWHYCRFVHHHHTLEDAALFPRVRRADPSLGSVLDRLEEDHLTVHRIAERIVSLSGRLEDDVAGIARHEMTAALGELENHLLSHLALEEQSIGPILSTWDSWPAE
jgi:hypothetical protein